MRTAIRASAAGITSAVALTLLSPLGSTTTAHAVAPGLDPVPMPSVEGPIPSDVAAGGHDHTFFASDLGLEGRGYVEEEFFYSGEANVYDATVAGGIGARPTASPTASIVSTGHNYTTRMVVRRPARDAKFNGSVVVEWLNATGGYDVEAMWFRSHEHLMRDGYAWVGITAQSGPITNASLGLKQFNPERYGSLDLTDGGTLTSGDRLSFDAFAQGMQAIRGGGVLGALEDDVETVIAAGVSQSAGRLSVYLNAIQTRTEQMADAALLYIGGERVRDDLDIPVLKLLSETEYTAPASANEISSLQPDTDSMRTWSMAGTSHSDWASFAVRYALLQRDQPSASLQDSCALPSRSRIPDRYVISSATEKLASWARDGVAPPTSDPITLAEDGTTVVRDNLGNALGGIRLAPFEVATALSTGFNENQPGVGGLCFLNGTHVPFDTETLGELYPTRKAYLTAHDAAVARNVDDGFVLPEDAREMRDDARGNVVGTGLTCETLCANVAQFPKGPSTQLLRDHTQFLYLRGGDHVVGLLDKATLDVARAQSDPPRAARHRADAIADLRSYQKAVALLERLGRATDGQSELLQGYAQVLIDSLDEGLPLAE